MALIDPEERAHLSAKQTFSVQLFILNRTVTEHLIKLVKKKKKNTYKSANSFKVQPPWVKWGRR